MSRCPSARSPPDIAQGVDEAYENRVVTAPTPLDLQGAGDQGLMFGTPATRPPSSCLADPPRAPLSQRLSEVRKKGEIPYLRPDGKTQVTIGYDGDRAVRLDTVVLSTQHEPDVDLVKTLTPTCAVSSSSPSWRGWTSTPPTSGCS